MKSILLLGLKGSGKSIVGEYLNSRYDLPIHKLGSKVREILSLEGRTVTEESVNEKSDLLKRSLSSHSIGELYLPEIDKLNEEAIIVVDSPRDVFDIKFYEKLSPTYLIGVFTEKEERYKRLLNREREGDALTIEGIIKEDGNQAEKEGVFFMISDYFLLNQGKVGKGFYRSIDQIFQKIKSS